MLSSSKKIAELEATIAEQNAATEELNVAYNAALAAKVTELSKLQTTVTDLTSKLGIALDDVATLKSQVADATTEIAEGIVNGIAAAGVEAIVTDPSANNSGNSKEMSRKDFEALAPAAQRAFCQAGGRPTD